MRIVADQFVLYTKPGCSSCLRAKEFLSRSGVDFIAVNILTDPEGVERLLKLGIRRVPVVVQGEKFVFGQNLEAVAAFVGLGGTGHTPLPPAVLVGRWINVMRAAQRYVRQFPIERIDERAIENRDRSIRVLSHHVFRIAAAFLESVMDGVDYSTGIADVEPAADACRTGDEIAQYADGVIARLQEWWTKNPDDSCQQELQTFYGPQSVHQLLERSTWHSAQHARQLIHILGRYGIDPDGPLVDEDLAGLPLPEGLFE